MAPKRANPAVIQPQTGKTSQRKRKASSKITDDNFLGAESNVVTKRLKQSADAARAATAAEKHRKRQPSVQDSEEEDDTVPFNIAPKNPHTILEAASASGPGSTDDDDVDMYMSDNLAPMAQPEDIKENRDLDEDVSEPEPDEAKHVETADGQRGESN
jgi:hypothetical protein